MMDGEKFVIEISLSKTHKSFVGSLVSSSAVGMCACDIGNLRILIMKILCVTAGATVGTIDQTVGTHPSTFSPICNGQEPSIS